jgi:hypothetical protein
MTPKAVRGLCSLIRIIFYWLNTSTSSDYCRSVIKTKMTIMIMTWHSNSVRTFENIRWMDGWMDGWMDAHESVLIYYKISQT